MYQSLFFSIASLLLVLCFVFYFMRRFLIREKDSLHLELQLKQQECEQLLREKQTLIQLNQDQIIKTERAESELFYLRNDRDKYLALQQQYQQALSSLATCNTKLEQAETALANQKEELKKMQDQNREEFRNMAQGILAEKQQDFAAYNSRQMEHLLTPFKTQLEDFRKRVDEVYSNEGKERHSLQLEIQRLVETSTRVGQEANNLTNALKTDVKKQGNWGEWILETILTNSGLTKDREFFLQQFIRSADGVLIKDENGQALQPDATIVFPDNRKVIADSKVSLLAWEQYVNASTEQEQQEAMNLHLKSVKAHIDGLHAKKYPKYAEALDYVLMFIPIEPAFIETLKIEKNLWKYAYDKGIVMVSPTNLLAVLKIIADLWRVEKQSRHAIEIAEKAGALYDKFHGFVGNFENIGKKLSEGQAAYDQAFKQLSTGTGNVFKRMEELKKMGAKASKQLGNHLLQSSEEEQEENAPSNE